MQANGENTLVTEESEVLPSEAPEILKNAEEVDNIQISTLADDLMVEDSLDSVHHIEASMDFESSNAEIANNVPETSNDQREKLQPLRGGSRDIHTNLNSSHAVSYFFVLQFQFTHLKRLSPIKNICQSNPCMKCYHFARVHCFLPREVLYSY